MTNMDYRLFSKGFWTYPENTKDAITKIDYFIEMDLSSDKAQFDNLTKKWTGVWFEINVDTNKSFTTITLTRVIDICRDPAVFMEFVEEMYKYLFRVYTSAKLH